MIRATIFISLYLVAAEALEIVILKQLRLIVSPEGSVIFQLPLLALGGILAGLTWGEFVGMGVALLAAALAGFSQPPPGSLGAAIVGFSVAAYLAGAWHRRNRQPSAFVLWLGLCALLIVSRWIEVLVRWFFWEGKPMIIPASFLVTAALTGLVGMGLFWLAPRLPRRARGSPGLR